MFMMQAETGAEAAPEVEAAAAAGSEAAHSEVVVHIYQE
jgi:hypothetical protein